MMPRLAILRALWRIVCNCPVDRNCAVESKPAVEVRATMRPKVYPILVRCVEDGVAYGWNRAHKHEDKPTEAAIREEIEQSVLSELCEAFDFDGEGQ